MREGIRATAWPVDRCRCRHRLSERWWGAGAGCARAVAPAAGASPLPEKRHGGAGNSSRRGERGGRCLGWHRSL